MVKGSTPIVIIGMSNSPYLIKTRLSDFLFGCVIYTTAKVSDQIKRLNECKRQA